MSEAVQYLLRTYETPTEIREAVSLRRAIWQKENETNLEFRARLKISPYRFGNVQTNAENRSLFFDGLHKTTRAIVERNRER